MGFGAVMNEADGRDNTKQVYAMPLNQTLITFKHVLALGRNK